MKQHGFLYTFTPVEDGNKVQNPVNNYKIIFMGPEGSNISGKITTTELMEKKLWDILFLRMEFGLHQLHFAVLDYYSEKYHLDLSVIHHEYELIERISPLESYHAYRTILSGEWVNAVLSK